MLRLTGNKPLALLLKRLNEVRWFWPTVFGR
jgi:hypothetical protein